MSRPSTRPSTSRPSGGGFAAGANRGTDRSAYGNLPSPGTRPSGGISSRPGGDRIAGLPSGGRPGAGTRPGADARPGAGTLPAGSSRPSTRDLQDFLDLPAGGYAGAGRPTTRPVSPGAGLAGGALAGGAAAEFLHNYPSSGLPGIGAQPGADDIASTLPARPGGGQRPAEGLRPGGEQPGIGRPGQPGERPGDIGRPGRPGERPADIGRPGRPVERPLRPADREWAQHLPSRIRDRDQWQDWRQNHGDQIRDYWRSHAGDYDDWYGDEWWLHNHLHDVYYPDFNYWAWAAWPAMAGWVGYGWSEPVYYNYGDNVYYQDNSVYYGDQPVATADEYAQQAEAIATSVPAAKPAADDWMPLGVFAITSDGKPTGAEPTMYLQLAVSKQGVINGTYQDTATNTVQSIEGMVDKQTQRAAWTAAGKTRPLMETGIVNLTKDTAPALVHFADGTTQQWLLVRLEQPTSK